MSGESHFFQDKGFILEVHEDKGYSKVSVNGNYAFWNPLHKCFIKMTGTDLTVSPKKEDGKVPSNWNSEVFAANKVIK